MEKHASHPRLTFAELPTVARIAVALSLFNSWVIFEEGAIDRFGLWNYLPMYIKSQFCPWDLAAAGLIFVPLLLLPARLRRGSQ